MPGGETVEVVRLEIRELRIVVSHRMKFKSIIAVWLLLALPIGLACAQELETDSLADEFSLADFVAEEEDATDDVLAEYVDVDAPESVVLVSDQRPLVGPGFRMFGRAGYGVALTGTDFDTTKESENIPLSNSSNDYPHLTDSNSLLTLIADGALSSHNNHVSPNQQSFLNFQVPNADYLRGFRDYGTSADLTLDDDDDNAQFPIEFVGSGPGQEYNHDFEIDNIDGDFAGGDNRITTVVNGQGIVYFVYDFDDLHTFNIRLDNLHVRQHRSVSSVELMGQHLWDWDQGILNRRPAWRVGWQGPGSRGPMGSGEFGFLPVADVGEPRRKERPNRGGWFAGFKSASYLAYGIRGNRGRDEIGWGASLEDSGGWNIFAYTRNTNLVIGPQLSLGRVTSNGRWRLDLSGHLLLGYSHVSTKLTGGFAWNASTVGLNSSERKPTLSHARRETEDFAQHVETRLTTSFLLSRHVTIDATVRGYATGPWFDSSEQMVWRLPNFGLQATGSDYLLGGDAFVGVTLLR